MPRAGAVLLAGLLLACLPGLPARAQEPAGPRCPVPDDLMLRDLSLPASRARLAGEGRLVILTLGGAPTAGDAAGDPGATYPARLQAALAAALPGKSVSVLNKASPKRETTTMLRDLPAVIRASGAHLVIWASGGREAARNADIDEYVADLQAGIDTIRRAGADVILLDLQYAPSIARITNTEPYRAALFGTAAANEVPVMRRYELMMQWSDDGVMNLDAQDSAERQEVARHLFACIASVLAPAIAEAVR